MAPEMRTILFFSQGQFIVSDESYDVLSLRWSEVETRQGFARREQIASIGTIVDAGYAILSIYSGRYQVDERHTRVVEVPLRIDGDSIEIQGPEEPSRAHAMRIAPGHYRVTAAQFVTGEGTGVVGEVIDLFLEPVEERLQGSRVIVADDKLDPPEELSELADEVVD